MSKPSLRQVAKELDISPAYLSYMVNGKRPWRKDLYQRYMGVVNTFVNSEAGSVNKASGTPPSRMAVLGVDFIGAGGGNRTHTPVKVADFKSAASTVPPPRPVCILLRSAIAERKGYQAIVFPSRFPRARSNSVSWQD